MTKITFVKWVSEEKYERHVARYIELDYGEQNIPCGFRFVAACHSWIHDTVPSIDLLNHDAELRAVDCSDCKAALVAIIEQRSKKP